VFYNWLYLDAVASGQSRDRERQDTEVTFRTQARDSSRTIEKEHAAAGWIEHMRCEVELSSLRLSAEQ
jgi:hypothetical protein